MRARLCEAALFATVLLSAAGCKRGNSPYVSELHRASQTQIAGESEPIAVPPREMDESALTPPGDYDLALVMGVVMTPRGNAVLLAQGQGDKLLPIFVGGTEALTIQLRLKGKNFSRPLTHDLLSALVRQLGAKPVRVQLDGVRGAMYLGSVFVQQGARVIQFDARPSDAIAFALGGNVPIFASRTLMKEEGISAEDLGGGGDAPGETEKRGTPSEPARDEHEPIEL